MSEKCYLTTQSRLPPFMAFPRFLLEYDLNETAKVLYILLLDRARVSMKKDEWLDADGHVYLHYTIKEMAAALRKSEMTVKTALSSLEEARLIIRRRQRDRRMSCIYVLVSEETENCPSGDEKLSVKEKENCLVTDRKPSEMETENCSLEDGKLSSVEKENCPSEERKLSVLETENCPSDGQNSFPLADRKLSPNINNRERIKEKDKLSYINTHDVMGQFQNVYLTEKQAEELRRNVLNFDEYVERLSRYMASTGKKYADHAATILDWAARDQRLNRQKQRDYSCQEGESL